MVTTFERREQERPEEQLPSMADEWTAPFAAMAAELALGAASASEAHSLVEEFWQEAVRLAQPPADEDG